MGSLGNALKLFWEWEGLYSQRYDVLHCTKSSPKRKISSPKYHDHPQGATLHLVTLIHRMLLSYMGALMTAPKNPAGT